MVKILGLKKGVREFDKSRREQKKKKRRMRQD
jgi:hypothetical protein